MNLTKINLLGFKSFADKLELDFTSGVTAIVGPNGCGKSNVADAIRWVLGEQSPKALRGDAMTDVIFNGTANRKSLSYCEVSLTFDNTDKAYAINADEVVVSRRLYRSKVANSEYLINGQQVRRQDIITLFRDTGIGKEGYSIIGQGKTAEILSKKPDERRKIFEEAAGVASYRNKIQNSEKNLATTRDNMVKLLAVMNEVEGNLRPLEKQAENAKKVKSLREELKVLEVNTYLYQTESSSGMTAKLEQNLQNINKELERNKAEDKDAEKTYEMAFMDFHNCDVLIDKLRGELSDLLVSQQKAEGDNKLYSAQIARLREEIAKITEDGVKNSALIEAKTKELNDKENEKADKFKKFVEFNTQYEKKNAEFIAFGETVAQREKEVERSRELILSSADELSDAKSATVKLTATRDVLLNNVGEDKEELKEIRGKILSTKHIIDKMRDEIDEIESRRAEKSEELEKASQNLQNCTAEIDEGNVRFRDAEKKRVELGTSLKFLTDAKNRLENYADSVRKLLIARDKDLGVNAKVLGVIGEMLTVPRDFQLAIEIALGGNIQNVVTTTQQDARYLIDYMAQNRIGRATFLPIETMRPNELRDDSVLDEDGVIGVASDLIKFDRKIAPVVSNLLGRTVVVEDKLVAERITKRYKNEFRVVTLDGALYLQSGAITGGQAPSKEIRILARESQLEEVQKRYNSADKAYEAIKRDLEEKIHEQHELINARNILSSQLDKIVSEKNAAEARKMVADSELASLENDEKNLLKDNEEVYAKIKELDALIAQSSSDEKNVSDKKNAADDILNEMKEEMLAMRRKRDAMSAEVSELKLKITNLDNDLTTLERECARLNSEIRNCNNITLELDTQKRAATAALAEAENKIDVTAFSATDRTRIDDIKTEIEHGKRYKNELTDRMKELTDKRSSLAEEQTELSAKRAQAAAKLERIKEDLLTMENKIVEDYQLTKETAEAYRVEDFDSENSLKNISKVKRQIDGYGAINELAVEQFEEQSEHYAELKTQFDDLEKAKADTESVISDLTSEMEKVFSAAFDAINENFKQIFAELFEGGKAELRIDTSEGKSVLDAPIDIYAQPKGKNLKTISLLSGGEQSLTAIAILFAIIRLKPMPFCVLDEIEAALDDVNTALFAEYLKRYADNTQFIVITHKKPTMERADVLYGITMQEVGVSTVVSVKLADAVKYVQKD